MLINVKIRLKFFFGHLSNHLRTVPPIHPLYSRQIDDSESFSLPPEDPFEEIEDSVEIS